MTALTQDRVKHLLRYDLETGTFVWLVFRNGRVKVGDTAGALINGYIRIGIDRKEYLAHRLAVLYVTGAWPGSETEVDHYDNNPTNNRWSNLRLVDHATNCENQTRPHRRNSSGFLGVSRCTGSSRWAAKVRVKGVLKHLGCFPTPEEAHQAYLTAKRAMHAGCTI